MVEDQIRNRILTISHAEFWPGITPFNVGDLDYGLWLSLALSCDEQIADRERTRAQIERAKSVQR